MSMTKVEFQTAFRDLISEEFCNIPEDGDGSHIFSDSFEKRMERLVRSTERIYWNWINTTAKRAAVIMVAILALLSSAMSVRAIREPVITFFTELYEKYIDISFGGDTSNSIEHEYMPTCLPEGFTLIDKQSSATSIITMYKGADSGLLILDQTTTGSTTASLDKEHGKITETFVGEIPALLYESDRIVLVLWAENAYYFVLSYQGKINPQVMLEIADSIA